MANALISSQGRARGTGKKKIEVKEIESKTQRMVTFSKRRGGLVRKLKEYSSLTNYFFAVVVFSPLAGRLYFYGNREVIAKYRKFIKKKEEAREEENKDKENKDKKNKDRENLKLWLRDVRLEEYDTVEKLDALKAKLRVIKDKVAKKLEGNGE